MIFTNTGIYFPWEILLRPFLPLNFLNASDFINDGAATDLSLPNADSIVLWLHAVQAIEKIQK